MGLPQFVYKWRSERDRLHLSVNGLNATISSQKNQINELEEKLTEKGKFFFPIKIR